MIDLEGRSAALKNIGSDFDAVARVSSLASGTPHDQAYMGGDGLLQRQQTDGAKCRTRETAIVVNKSHPSVNLVTLLLRKER
jgi:hypothetical protein